MSKDQESQREIDPTILSLFWQLTTSEDSPEEKARAVTAWQEYEQNASSFKGSLVYDGLWPLMVVLLKIYRETGQGPSEATMLTFCREDYDDFYSRYVLMDESEASPHSVTSLAAFIEAAVKSYNLKEVLKKIRETADSEGSDAAVKFMFQEAAKLPSAATIIESNLSSSMCLDQVVSDLDERIKQCEEGTLNIKTGLGCVDRSGTVFQRGEVVAILGSGGGGKTTMARTISYNATIHQRYKVLHFPLETTVQVESPLFVAQHVLRNKPSSLRRGALKDGTIGRDRGAYDDFKWGITDLKRLAADGAIRLPTFVDFVERSTWSAIRKEIYRQLQVEKIDLVVVDYLTLVSKEGAQSPREFMEEVIIDLARFAKDEGVAILTPVQANRNSTSIVETGIWSKEQIFNYSEIEKSFDLIYSVYHGPYLHERDRMEDGKPIKKATPSKMMDGHVFIGTCKTRSVAPIETPVSAMLRHDGLYLSDPTPTEITRLRLWDSEVDDPDADPGWEAI
jgi:energy-coupling factor transporter ATP-binding protein EcfA2